MAHKTEVWGKDRRFRCISAFKHDGVFDICRSYGSTQGYTVQKMVSHFQLRQTALVLGGYGREKWNHDISHEQAEVLVSGFRRSAKKAGFIDFGIAER